MENFLKERKYLTIIYFLMTVSVCLKTFIIPLFFSSYTKLLNVFIWIFIWLTARNVSNQHNRFKGQKEKLKTIFIIVALYMIMYYLSGLFFGFFVSAYSHSLLGITSNLFFFVFIIVLQEYTRSRLINNTRSVFLHLIITSYFIILSLDYTKFSSNFASGELTFRFFASILYPVIIRNVLCTFLVRYGSYKLSLMFLLPQKAFSYLTPVIPDLDWFVIIAFDSALVMLTYYYIYYEHLIKVERFTRKEIRAGNPRTVIPSVLFVIAFTFFVAGFFRVQPVSVMSNSMKPYIKRGDVVFVRKIKKEQIKNLCVGDIIEYSIDDKTVIHRIISIRDGEDGELEFITKGDANSTDDFYPVKEKQIVGIAKYRLPYAGYPSVIFSENILKKESEFLYEGVKNE